MILKMSSILAIKVAVAAFGTDKNQIIIKYDYPHVSATDAESVTAQ
jgi:hypothetical protein